MRHSGEVPAARSPSAERRQADAARAEVARLATRVEHLEHALADRAEVETTHAEHIAQLEAENRTAAARATRFEQRVRELENELARKHESEAVLELLADGQITEKERLRTQSEEIQALQLAVECARAENVALQERLADERAHKERLLEEVARIQLLLDGLKKRAR
jgi:hypothetical protein